MGWDWPRVAAVGRVEAGQKTPIGIGVDELQGAVVAHSLLTARARSERPRRTVGRGFQRRTMDVQPC